MTEIKGWKDGEEHYCPCNGRCHTEEHPCSLSCVDHHHLIILDQTSVKEPIK